MMLWYLQSRTIICSLEYLGSPLAGISPAKMTYQWVESFSMHIESCQIFSSVAVAGKFLNAYRGCQISSLGSDSANLVPHFYTQTNLHFKPLTVGQQLKCPTKYQWYMGTADGCYRSHFGHPSSVKQHFSYTFSAYLEELFSCCVGFPYV